ncbi:MBL fold metallo-hydrolase [Kitasatospora sp. NPDC052896]|uniref:MBL fold metallo-hydrolase n=1 Tax=Kitasatospora sp. NPDC052896 TaxID=3364061 RepID=UPI0037CB2FD8
MDIVEVLPQLHMLRFEVGQAYLWCEREGITLIDSGPAGSAPAIAEAIRAVGREPAEVRRVVLTHGHDGHTGGAVEAASWGGGEILAGWGEAAVLRGEQPMPAPVLADWERELMASIPLPPPVGALRVDRELVEGDTLEFGGGAQVLEVPGHTGGSIALHLPGPRVLFTGDTIANVQNRTMLGVFNTDPDRAAQSLERQSGLDVATACFGHGEPILTGAAERLRRAIRQK